MLKKRWHHNIVKIAAAGATIFGVGWSMLVLQPKVEEPVKQADADIFGFEFAEKSDQQKFVDTLMREGMEEPRVYDHNGNTMFFSTVLTDESPRQVLERFQRGFVETGLNERVHMSPLSFAGSMEATDLTKDRAEYELQQKLSDERVAYMNDYVGGVVPVLVERDRVIMTGATTKTDAADMFEWVDEVAKQHKTTAKSFDLGDSVKAMRYVDAVRDGSMTRVSAVWSDEEYSPKKIADQGEDLNVDPEVPTCPGCKRLMHFEGKSEKSYANHAFDGGGQSVDQVLDFYRRSLESRGWQVSETASVIEQAERIGMKPRSDARMLQFARGTEFVTVSAWPGENGTGVHVARSN